MDENNVLRLGYVRENFPYVSACSLRGDELRRCKNPGIMSELWLQFAEFYGYQIKLIQNDFYGGYNETTRQYYGLLYLLMNNQIDATLSLLTPNELRVRLISLGPVMTTYETGFVYGQANPDQSVEIKVFDWWSFSLILITYFLIFLLNLKKYRKISKTLNVVQKFITLEKFPKNPFLLLGYFEIYLLYSAGFRSQTISNSLTNQPFSTEAKFSEKLNQKTLQVLIQDETMFPNVENAYPSKSLYDRAPPMLVEDYSEIVNKICSNKKFVYFGNIAQMGGIWFVKPPCPIKVLSYPHNNSIQTTLVIGYRKNLPKNLKQKIQDFMSNLISVEAFDKHWGKMYKSYYSNNPQILIFSSIKLLSLIQAIYIYLVLILISFGILILEWLWLLYLSIIFKNYFFKIHLYSKNYYFIDDNWILEKNFEI